MRRVAGMPDLHPGRGYPVGAAFFSTGRLYPALIGGDIGCGMSLWSTGIDARKAATAKLEKRLGDIDGPLDDSWQPLVDELAPADVGHRQALGTIGGGNHFAELQRIDTVCDPQAVDALGLDLDRLVLLVHSGSRGLGRAILEEHVQRHGHDGLAEDSADCQAYLARHDAALRYAQANRQLVARRMLDRLGTEGGQLLDVHHNLVTRADVQGEQGWLHRGLVVIPADFSYLVVPLRGDGAGRKWMRSECKDRLFKRYSPAQLAKTRLGSHVICEDKQLIYEEAPEAYKPVDSIIASLEQAGLLTVLAKLRPVLTYKTRGGCC